MFNKYPVNPVRHTLNGDVQTGFNTITSQVLTFTSRSEKHVLRLGLDGTHGSDFQKVLQKIVDALEKQDCIVQVFGTNSYLKSGEELRAFFAENITDNRAFGYVTHSAIEDYFRGDAREQLGKQLVEAEQRASVRKKSVLLIFGPGAYWLAEQSFDLSYFLDVSREYQQVEHRKQLLNIGMTWNRDTVEKYKICYFVEWPVFETYRKHILGSMDYYVDMNNPAQPVTTTVQTLREMIRQIAQAPLRVKPFFAPGIWGGQFLKQFADLPQEWPNCAWSFEPIAPENSILIRYEDTVIEVPFLIIMFYEYRAIMGERPVKLFGDYFPVRFDYLDTMDGGNLSLQVHAKQEYVKETFNEFMSQQESYYMMEHKEGSKVYLGLTNNCTKEGLYDAIQHAQSSEEPLPLTDYVNDWDVQKGDLFLIPPGTIHTSGKDNLVLEISSTTWWFTFKIYDFLRKDSDGKPRPLNIDHGFDNIDFFKQTDWVKDNLMPSPQLIGQQGNNEQYLLGKRDDLLFYVMRIHLHDEWSDNTNGEFVMFNLVEGERVRIVSSIDESVYVEFAFAEAYILPAVFGEYKIINLGKEPCKLVQAGVSPDWDVILLES